MHKSLTRCFTFPENHSSLDHLFFLVYQRVLVKKSYTDTNGLAQLNMRYANIAQECEFETNLHAAHLIHLSRDALIQIDAALNEMEAMDYRDWVWLSTHINDYNMRDCMLYGAKNIQNFQIFRNNCFEIIPNTSCRINMYAERLLKRA